MGLFADKMKAKSRQKNLISIDSAVIYRKNISNYSQAPKAKNMAF
jgi:hypothetical protein